MTIFNYSPFCINTNHLNHSAKGSTWEEHKYIKRIDGTYYYPDNYEGGRHLPNDNKNVEEDATKLSKEDIEKLAKEVIRGNFGNGQVRKDLLGENYSEIQKRVNEIIKGSTGSIKVSEVSQESIKKVEEAAKKVSNTPINSNVHSGINIDEVLSVYKKDRR